jgi:hypothetical protein
MGDGFCDDDNNNKECEFDLGDCCNNVNINWNQYCSICECLNENDVVDCKYPVIGNGICNDKNNNAYCYYDGGDCSNSFSTTLSPTSTEAPYECCGKIFLRGRP